MTIRNNAILFQSRIRLSGLVCALLLAGLSGCSSTQSSSESITGKGPVGYQSGKVQNTRGLEVPPDLTQLQRDNRYALPSAPQGSASASEYMQQRQNVQPAGTVAVSSPQDQGMRIEREGNQRWLVVEQAPEALWPEVKRFWKEAGFNLETEMREAGIMETEWAENRAKLPQDIIRRTLGKVLDSFWSTGERDKFRTRLERRAAGGTEIYISHRGVEEVLVGAEQDRTTWTARPSDPELEAEFLARLMVYLGADKAQAKQAAASSTPPVQDRARLVKDGGEAYVEIGEGFDRAWRRVGLALDRSGFTVEDRNRAEGIYFVRYVDQEEAQQNQGFFSRLFSSEGDKKAVQYRIAVQGDGARSRIRVLGTDGKPEQSRTGDRILILLQDQLK